MSVWKRINIFRVRGDEHQTIEKLLDRDKARFTPQGESMVDGRHTWTLEVREDYVQEAEAHLKHAGVEYQLSAQTRISA